MAGIAKTTTLVSEIAVASNEQASGIAQVNQGMGQIAQVTQSNTATAEQSAAASEELAAQAEVFKEMVQKFKLKDSEARLSNANSIIAKLRESERGPVAAQSETETAVTRGLGRDSCDYGKY